MTSFLLKGGRIVDGSQNEPTDPVDVIVSDGKIVEVGRELRAGDIPTINLSGKTLMPGLVDCHVHVIAVEASLARNAQLSDSVVTARSSLVLRNMLMRGFTTVRDVGGADFGVKWAVDAGIFAGPRMIICGKALSQTGGHCDFRGRFDDRPTETTRHRLGSLGRICDGIPEIRRAAREEIKSGAEFLKIMANGGCASPTDPIHFLGFAKEELAAIVEEAGNAGTYVSAHVYTDEAIRRCVDAGVRSLEHCNLIRSETAEVAAARSAFAVPTLVTYEMLVTQGASLGLSQDTIAKAETVRSEGMNSLSIMSQAKLPMAFGSDLLGDMHDFQSDEFVIRSRVLPTRQVIASATTVAAKLCNMEGLIGTIAPGAFADLIVVDGNPLEDIALLTGQGRHMPLIMKDGKLVKNSLSN